LFSRAYSAERCCPTRLTSYPCPTLQRSVDGALRNTRAWRHFPSSSKAVRLIATVTSITSDRYLEVNELFERITGWARRDVIGRTTSEIEIWNRDQRADIIRWLEDGAAVRNVEIEAHLRNGEVRTGLGSAELLEIDGDRCLLWLVTDAIVSTRALAALRESEERFRLFANPAPVMLWMSGPDKRCTQFNQSWLAFTGRPIEAELGDGRAEGVHPDDLTRCLDTYNAAFDQRKPFRMENRLRRQGASA
jgi:PAS domain S-box-containing protein